MPRLLSYSQAADYAGLDPRRIRDFVRMGALPRFLGTTDVPHPGCVLDFHVDAITQALTDGGTLKKRISYFGKLSKTYKETIKHPNFNDISPVTLLELGIQYPGLQEDVLKLLEGEAA
jgi:hypothetical protein